jgi:hypothetical protein
LKIFFGVALGAFALGAASLMGSAPAHAATCTYVAYDMKRNLFTEPGRALKMSEACDRARRQCNRQLERWRKQGRVARGSGCARMIDNG